MAVQESFSKTAKIALAATVVWAVAGTGGCVALYAEIQEKEQAWAKERATLSGEIATLKERNAALDKELAGLRNTGKGLADLQQLLTVARAKLKTATTRHTKVSAETAAAKKSLEDVRLSLDEHKTRIAQRRAEIDSAETRLGDLQGAAKSADARIEEARKTLAKLKADIRARENDVHALETSLQSARTSLNEAIDRIDKARKPGS